jgi:hypothetical protein
MTLSSAFKNRINLSAAKDDKNPLDSIDQNDREPPKTVDRIKNEKLNARDPSAASQRSFRIRNYGRSISRGSNRSNLTHDDAKIMH